MHLKSEGGEIGVYLCPEGREMELEAVGSSNSEIATTSSATSDQFGNCHVVYYLLEKNAK